MRGWVNKIINEVIGFCNWFVIRMNVFFNPVEVRRSSPKRENPYEIHKYNDDPFKLTEFSVDSITDQKRKIIQWLKRMPVLERSDQLTFTNKEFVCLVMQMYYKQQNSAPELLFSVFQNEMKQFALRHKLCVTEKKNGLSAAEQELLNSIIIMNKFTRFDSISLSEEMVHNIDRLFQLFQIIEDGISHELTYQDYKRYSQKNNEFLFYKPNQSEDYSKSLGLWIVQILKKNLSIQYFRSSPDSSVLQDVGSEFSTRQHIKSFQKLLKHATEQQKKDLFNRIFQTKIINLIIQHRQIVRVSSDFFPQVYQTEPQEIDKFVKTLMESNPKKLFQLVAFSTLKETQESYAYYKFEIYLALEQKIRKIEEGQKKNMIGSSNISKGKSIIRSRSLKQGAINQLESNEASIFVKKKSSPGEYQQGNDHCSLNLNHHEPAENAKSGQMPQKLSQDKQSFLKNKNKRKKKNKKRALTPKDEQKMEDRQSIVNKSEKGFITCSQTTTLNEPDFSQFEDSERVEIVEMDGRFTNNSTKKVEQNPNQNADSVSSQNVLEEIMNKIKTEAGYTNKHRKIITNRIGLILSHLNLSYKLYGSCACGLALSSSDIDVSVDPTIVHYFYAEFCSYRQKIVKSLEFLKQILKPMKWVADIVVIPGASIPLLNFTANPLEPYQPSPSDSRLNILRGGKNREISRISVDITVDSFINMTHQIAPHLGFQATILMKEWLNIYPQILNLTLFMKQLLYTHGYNKAYTGGVSSFTLMVLIVAYNKLRRHNINNNNLGGKTISQSQVQQKPQQVQMIVNFLKFIAQFEEKLYGIDLRRQNDPVFKRIQSTSGKPIFIVSPLNGQLISESCYQFGEIKNVAKEVMNLVISIGKQDTKELVNNSKANLLKALFGK